MTSDRDVDEWLDKLEPGETAFKLTSFEWRGPEFVGTNEDGDYLRWPVGLSNPRAATVPQEAVEKDIRADEIAIETVDFDGTPLAEEEDDG